jgi:nitroimidazol reductase NimA-like FMN-containing flavoprotein (pyridoxamine 5'-phosphate oxidase superfamily)
VTYWFLEVVTVSTPTPRTTDHAGLGVLSLADCLTLAASQPVGRVAFLWDGEIEVLPVNHRIVGQAVAFRSGGGSKLTAAFHGAVVAFEVDAYDASQHTGWSVLVKGRAEVVTDEPTLARLRATRLRSWSPAAPRSEWVLIRPDEISGRRL